MRLPAPGRQFAVAWRAAWLLGGLGLIAVVVLQATRSGLTLAALQVANPVLLLLALLPALVAPVAHAWRWKRMLLVLGQTLPLRSALGATVAATVASYAVPGYAWAPVKGLVARQAYGVGLMRSAPTLVIEQALDAAMFVVGAGFGFVLAPGLVGGWSLRPPLAALGIAVLGVIALAALVVTRRRRPPRFSVLRSSGYQLLRSQALYPWLAGLSLLRWIADLAAFWLVAAALGLRLELGRLLVLANLPALLGMVSPVPGGLGIREGSVLAAGSMLGLSPGTLALVALLHRTVLLAGLPLALVVSSRVSRSRP